MARDDCDLRLVADDGEILVHRVVASAVSSFIEQALTNDTPEPTRVRIARSEASVRLWADAVYGIPAKTPEAALTVLEMCDFLWSVVPLTTVNAQIDACPWETLAKKSDIPTVRNAVFDRITRAAGKSAGVFLSDIRMHPNTWTIIRGAVCSAGVSAGVLLRCDRMLAYYFGTIDEPTIGWCNAAVSCMAKWDGIESLSADNPFTGKDDPVVKYLILMARQARVRTPTKKPVSK